MGKKPSSPVTDLPEWLSLKKHTPVINRKNRHLKYLITEKGRLENFSLNGAGIFYDFSRQRVDAKTMSLLLNLAEARKIKKQFKEMTEVKKVNNTEKREALHTASRSFSNEPLLINGKDVMPDFTSVRKKIKEFASGIHTGEIKGSTGKTFEHIVVIGIGGSYLGPEFVASALKHLALKKMKIHFLSNVDINNFGEIASVIDPESTLWIVISKSYTTSETTANTNQAYEFMMRKGLDPAKHFATVTSKGSPGDDPSNPVVASFHMFDFIGGRYSVTSAVGGVPLALYLGYDVFERFLKGAEEMDIHAKETPPGANLPLVAALISVWNNNFLRYPAQAIIPYSSPLSKLAPHIQQLNMESNGKYVTCDGMPLGVPAGTIIFGEPGTNAQHSFFQLAHQGRPFPIDFIGVINPCYEQYKSISKGVTNHQELWANLIAQPAALAAGKDDADTAKYFPGNRPSSTILLEDLSPENIGRLLSFYEAKTVYEAFIWSINPFDQFGVELGKKLASGIRSKMAEKNKNPDYSFKDADPVTGFYLEKLFKGYKK
ncbi:MAG: glucose-6-phosphate isomerase [Thermodesulfobacteriota bacterium]|nr:glucose-6-phosphate isomerase [Thermodesulfobacteriota bacterium]